MERIFIPGSRWLFFKLYTGTLSADILLTRHISPFVRRLRESGAIDDFFYIRCACIFPIHRVTAKCSGHSTRHSSLAWKAAS